MGPMCPAAPSSPGIVITSSFGDSRQESLPLLLAVSKAWLTGLDATVTL